MAGHFRAERDEIEARRAIVRAAKRAKERAGFGPWLTPEELDRVIEPIPCRRTRDRARYAARPGDRLFDVP